MNYDDYNEENEETIDYKRELFAQDFYTACDELTDKIRNWSCSALWELNIHSDIIWFDHEDGYVNGSYWWPNFEMLLSKTGMRNEAEKLGIKSIEWLTKEYPNIIDDGEIASDLFDPYMEGCLSCFDDAYPGSSLLNELEKEYGRGVVKIKNETDNWNELHVDLGKIAGKKAKGNELTFLIVFGEDMLVSNENEFYDYYIGTGHKQNLYYFTDSDRDNVIEKIQKALTEI